MADIEELVGQFSEALDTHVEVVHMSHPKPGVFVSKNPNDFVGKSYVGIDIGKLSDDKAVEVAESLEALLAKNNHEKAMQLEYLDQPVANSDRNEKTILLDAEYLETHGDALLKLFKDNKTQIDQIIPQEARDNHFTTAERKFHNNATGRGSYTDQETGKHYDQHFGVVGDLREMLDAEVNYETNSRRFAIKFPDSASANTFRSALDKAAGEQAASLAASISSDSLLSFSALPLVPEQARDKTALYKILENNAEDLTAAIPGALHDAHLTQPEFELQKQQEEAKRIADEKRLRPYAKELSRFSEHPVEQDGSYASITFSPDVQSNQSAKERAEALADRIADIRNQAGISKDEVTVTRPISGRSLNESVLIDLAQIESYDQKNGGQGTFFRKLYQARGDKPEPASNLTNEEALKNIEQALGIGKEFGITPEIRTLESNGHKADYIVYQLAPDALSFGLGAEARFPGDTAKKLGQAIDSALNTNSTATGLDENSLIFSMDDKGTVFAFPIEEIKERNKDGQYFERLTTIAPQLQTAVKHAADEALKPEREKADRYESYKNRLSEIFDTKVFAPSVQRMGEGDHLALDIGSREDNDQLIDRLVPIRNKAGLTKDEFPLGTTIDGSIRFDLALIDKYEEKNGPGSLFAKLESVKQELQTTVKGKPAKSFDQEYAEQATKLSKELGLKEKFDDDATVTVNKSEIRIDLNKVAMSKLPRGSRSMVAGKLMEVIGERIKTNDIYAGINRSGHDKDSAFVVIQLNEGINDQEAVSGIERFIGSQKKAETTALDESFELARQEQFSSYGSSLMSAFGSNHTSRVLPDLPAHTILKFDDKSYDPSKTLQKTTALFKKRFGIDESAFQVLDSDPTVTSDGGKVVKVDVSAIAAYDDKHGEGAFVEKFAQVEGEFTKALEPEKVPEKQVAPEETPPADNKGQENQNTSNDPPAEEPLLTPGKGIGALVLGALAFFGLSSSLGPIGGVIAAIAGAVGGYFAGGYAEKSWFSSDEASQQPGSDVIKKQALGIQKARDGMVTGQDFAEVLGDPNKASGEEKRALESLKDGSHVILTPEAKEGNLGAIIYAEKAASGELSNIQVALEGSKLVKVNGGSFTENDTQKILTAARDPNQSTNLDKHSTLVDDIVAPLTHISTTTQLTQR